MFYISAYNHYLFRIILGVTIITQNDHHNHYYTYDSMTSSQMLPDPHINPYPLVICCTAVDGGHWVCWLTVFFHCDCPSFFLVCLPRVSISSWIIYSFSPLFIANCPMKTTTNRLYLNYSDDSDIPIQMRWFSH